MGMGLEAVTALLYKELEKQQTKATHFYRERERERERERFGVFGSNNNF